MRSNTRSNLAVLIDAENVTSSAVSELFEEVSRYGTATIRRAYGNWTTPQLGGWKEFLHSYAIQPVQQFSYATGKNATDAALIIDAMDLLHGGKIDAFCLVSSDSDFTRLATRAREAGLVVYGFGEAKSAKSFVAACDKFVYLEILKRGVDGNASPPSNVSSLEPLLTSVITGIGLDDGWAPLSRVGSDLLRRDPSFDPRNFGFKKLGELVQAQAYLEVKHVLPTDGSMAAHVLVRVR